ncbi:hypothetical protein [Christiangramia echinicola]|uniref:Uncharacterized protein n=1 Tax=Christiangramia echinicola TaxID=279359 RepID=A0A1H1KVZ1_9FLAO|nr:hypothetical protein [Christiangramia echinicola]SDR65945.1 hypothetical protein SAMN04488552_0217 [Christiangramia echinicola]
MWRFLKNKLSILFIFSVLLILINVVIITFDFRTINDPMGVGVTALTVGMVLGFCGIAVDYILVKIIKNKPILNITELVMIAIFLYWVWPH